MSIFPIPLHASLLALGVTAPAATPAPSPAPVVTAIVEQCVTSASQAERAATFSAQMTAIAGTQRMAMRIDVQERGPTESAFHKVVAGGLGVWRQSDPGVKIYKYLKQVTNLTAPAAFRAVVHYHWIDEKGHVIRRLERHTPVCREPVQISAVPGSQSVRHTGQAPASPELAQTP
jgi:hypothetical protein